MPRRCAFLVHFEALMGEELKLLNQRVGGLYVGMTQTCIIHPPHFLTLIKILGQLTEFSERSAIPGNFKCRRVAHLLRV